jgi:hypothetical protein
MPQPWDKYSETGMCVSMIAFGKKACVAEMKKAERGFFVLQVQEEELLSAERFWDGLADFIEERVGMPVYAVPRSMSSEIDCT